MENYAKDTERLIKTLELEMKKKRVAAYVDPEKALEAKEKGTRTRRFFIRVDLFLRFERGLSRALFVKRETRIVGGPAP